MKLVRAMKQVARLQGEIKDLQHRASSCLSTSEENQFDELFDPVMQEITIKTDKVVTLKTRIMKANINADIFKEILVIGELKKHMAFLRELDVQTGMSTNRYGENPQAYKSQMTKAEKIEKVKVCQAEINIKIDALDEFNAKTDV